ncbi:MAG: MBL fold metallo-hydrolase [Clostridiales bacterium]|nr:MBL fold metallo-hydrolase [Clostridiales bacterium]
MRFKILCKYGKYPSKFGGTSSFLINDGETNVVLDMGSGSAIALDAHVPFQKVSAIVLSHLHFDHISDLFSLVYRSRETKIPVYLPESPKEIFDIIEGTNAFDLYPIKDGMTVNIGSVLLKFCKMTHPVETYAIRAECGKNVLVYTADTTYNENIAPTIRGSRYVFADACVRGEEHTKYSPHISVKEIARITREAGAEIVLIHLPPVSDNGDILREALSENPAAKLGETDIWYEF